MRKYIIFRFRKLFCKVFTAFTDYLSDQASRMIKFSIFPRVYCLFPIPFLSTSSSRFPPHRQTVSAGSSDSRGKWRQLTDHTISNLSLVRYVASLLFIPNVLCFLAILNQMMFHYVSRYFCLVISCDLFCKSFVVIDVIVYT